MTTELALDAPSPVQPLLSLQHVSKQFPGRSGGAPVLAVDDVSLDVAPGEVLGLVGESGCGKTTLTRVIMQLLDASAGSISFDGKELTDMSRRDLLAVRREMQIVLQDPYASLNPRMRVHDIVAEPLHTHHLVPKGRKGRAAARETVSSLLESVGLDPAVQDRYPHEFSGGQRQRIGIARALALEPRLVVCDEPVSALDVSVQAQILKLLRTLQTERGLSYVFVSHDLSVMRQVADRIAVMYLGQIVEIAETEELFHHPRHPYTQALLSAVPLAATAATDTPARTRVVLAGDPPSPANPPSGCRFRTRCPLAREACAEERPPLMQQGAPGHEAACFFPVDSIAELAAEQARRQPSAV
ncbi:ABC transporter ATP-binding protein [Aeromicrobium chenweiae]|uniref:ABC transporter ATP-binding protein n=1 Tax=Aeromicrobium chenweiae TaxID=2079793 RepID=UPI0019013DA8|nr:oligopeptide/dipeptide ABC transporter ATP-binding protein [Aeromicrobium chenweiae]